MREIFEEKKLYETGFSVPRQMSCPKGSRDQTTMMDSQQAFADNVSTSQQTTTKYCKRNWLWIQLKETNLIILKKKEANGPHRSPEKHVHIYKYICSKL